MTNSADYAKFWSPAFDTMDDFIFLIDKEFHIIRVNKSFLNFMKGRPEDFTGKMCYNIIHGTNTPFGECPHARMLSTGKFEHSEFFEPRLKKWLYVRTTPIFDDDNNLIGSIHMAADLTELRKAGETLRDSKEKFRILIENSQNIVYTLDLNGVFTFVSPAWTELLGHPVSQVEGKPFQIFVHPEDIAKCEAFMKVVASTGKTQSGIEYRVRHANGSWLWHLSNAAPLKDKNGEVLGFEGIASDVTDRKKAEKALAENKEKVLLLLDSTAEAIYGLDMNGNCTFCNSACLRMLGYKRPDELLGKNMHKQIHSKHPDGTPFPVEECRVFKAFKDGKGAHADDEVFWRSDGTAFPAEYWSYPQLSNNVIIGAVVTFLDITERKKIEENQKELQRELENRIESLERFQKITIDRELKMRELKTRIKELEAKSKDGNHPHA